MKKTLCQAYRSKVAEACASEKGMCQFSRWSRNKTVHRPLIPAIEGETYPKQKAKKFPAKFFSLPPNASIKDIANYTYPESVKTHSCISKHDIQRSILNALAKNCPGSDGIPNEILKIILEFLLLHLYRIFNACFTIGYYK